MSSPALAVSSPVRPARRTHLYARVWRWHFFAGLFVAPFAITLAVTGSIYLFRPQIEAAQERSIGAGLQGEPALPADDLVRHALAHAPGARLQKFLPARRGESDPTAEVQVQLPGGESRLLWIERSSGRVVHEADPEALPVRVVQKLHGELLGGRVGSALVELAACWMILLIASGLYLSWPRGRSLARVLVPRLDFTNRRWLREFHASAGVWVSGLALVLLFSGLPWTGVWGGAFQKVQAWTGLDGGRPRQDHGGHRGGKGAAEAAPWTLSSADERGPAGVELAWLAPGRVTLQDVVERAAREPLANPVEIVPPADADAPWIVRSQTQRRPDRVTLKYDARSGEPIGRTGFADQPPLQRAVSLGIALHEGQLFGPLNQLLGLLVALGVIAVSASGVLMWWQRRPAGSLAVPPLPSELRIARGLTVLILTCAAFFPLVGASLIAVAIGEQLWTRLCAPPALTPSAEPR